MQENHPIDRIVIALEGEAPDPLVTAMRASARQLAERRSWVLDPPHFLPEWTGFGLSLYTARPPFELDPEVDRAHLAEVKELLGEVCRLSGEHGVSFQVEFAGEFIGMVEAGRMDSGIEEILIDEWERVVNVVKPVS